ncbi:MAG: N-6 DNA methylase [Candidatus ainarchaeum sp.]|nr:N-6 DNA methylase [Candidatus ainarchaeum sp.]
MAKADIRKAAILDLIKKHEKPITPEEIAKKIGISWNTAEKYLQELKEEGIVELQKVGGQNLFIPKEKATSKLTQQELETHLWKAADILRGSIDSSDYKNYIFGMLFLKRLNDVFEEEAEKIEKEMGNKKAAWEDPDEHQFFVPPRARWEELRKTTSDIGAAINKANEALEEQNPLLEGVLGVTDFNNKDRLPDRVLSKLILHFSAYRLRNSDLSEPDLLGRAYEYLIKQFADDAGKKGGEFYTPQKVVQLIAHLLKPEEGMRACDPCLGSAGMLIEIVRYLREHKKNPQNISLYGQEKNLNTWAICKMNLLLHGVLDARIEKGDTLLTPKLLEDRQLMLFDRVIANPMWNQNEWGRDELVKGDPYGRFSFGLPPQKTADWAWIQHMFATLKDNGQLGIVLDNGVLFRGGQEGTIRQKFLEKDFIEAVISLPANLFYNTPSPGCILIINRAKEAKRKGKILFIYAANDFEEGKAQNFLRDSDLEKIWNAFDEFKDIEKYAKVATLKEIGENDYNLNVTRYVDITEQEEKINVKEAYLKLRSNELKRNETEKELEKYLKELGYYD